MKKILIFAAAAVLFSMTSCSNEVSDSDTLNLGNLAYFKGNNPPSVLAKALTVMEEKGIQKDTIDVSYELVSIHPETISFTPERKYDLQMLKFGFAFVGVEGSYVLGDEPECLKDEAGEIGTRYYQFLYFGAPLAKQETVVEVIREIVSRWTPEMSTYKLGNEFTEILEERGIEIRRVNVSEL